MFYSEKENIASVLFNGEHKDLNNTIDIIKLSTLTERDITKGTTPTTLGYELLSKPTIDNIKFFKIEDIGSKNAKPKNFITKECHDKLSRSKLEKDDILFSIAGSIGKTYKVREEDLPANTNQALAIIRLKNKKQVDFYKNYIDYIVNTLTKHAKGGVISNFNLANLKNVDILSFSDEEINIISKSLNKQEYLIDSYKEKLSLLEEQEAYYQDELLSGRLRIRLTDESINYVTQQGWYLNDDLVEGKEKDFEEWISAEFHSKVDFYKETEFKQETINERIKDQNIPVDWNVLKVKDFCNVVNGKAFKPTEWDKKQNGLKIIRIQNLKGNNEYNYYNGEYDSRYIINKEDLLFSWSATIAAFTWKGDTALLNQHIFKINLNDCFYKDYFFHILEELAGRANNDAHGGGGMVHIKKGTMESYKFLLPKNKLETSNVVSMLNLFKNQKSLIVEKIKIEEEKMDYLMDELLSGRIRVQ